MKSDLCSTPSMSAALRKVIQRRHYPLEIMLTCVRWYVAYPLSLRHIEEMMAERGVSVDHATIHRWSLKMLPVLAAVFRTRKRPVGSSWRMDEAYILVSGQWKYLYRAVDANGRPLTFCSAPSVMLSPPAVFLSERLAFMKCPKRSASTAVLPTRQLSWL